MKDTFDDLIPANLDGDPLEGGSLQGLEEYERFEVAEKHKTIKREATDLVSSLIKVYFDADLIDEHEHLKAIKNIETSNLIGLIESARYAQHAVSTLMRKIDAGLHAEMTVYPILIELQKSAIDIQMKVANYSRTLSPYIKSVKEDLEESGNTTIEILSRVESDSIDRNDEANNVGEEVFRGSMDMNKYFRKKLDAIEKQKEERAEKVRESLDNKDYTDYEDITSTDDDISDEEE